MSRAARLRQIANDLDKLCACPPPAKKSTRKAVKKSVRKTAKVRAPRVKKHEAFTPALARSVAGKLHGDARFGRYKVYIGDLTREIAKKTGQTSAEIKQELIAAHKRGELHLSRADLTSTMPQDKVRESEVPYLNAFFHFLNTER